ncbi:TonB-dependent receptor [Chitinophaga sedimenti]|uniref:SusC/RagA family TonB-linked outer membrane protein n=1 Tax=Chitinophaga sedimenti TaxID=2033606 RepID=UPI0020055377|nr:TonB-dependent receptor [Chitinophaga sedimenti]MCK7555680.1 TonB-dependent receptor [Chitinophaga sedimenti]
MRNILFGLCCLLFLLATLPAAAQTETIIRGSVTDGKQPLPGVTVVEKGIPTNGATTDEKGSFTLKLRGTSQTLTVSFLGYLKQEVSVAGKSAVNITLKEDYAGLEEVVIIGFGEKPKITNTGAVSAITGVELRQSPSASLQNSLAGRLPGLFSQQRSGQPGRDGASFQIRGISSYTNDNNPLIIVDDIEFTYSQVAQLDPNEVESVSILKDASTTAVYGIRGANGVLVIKTRRGKSGKPQLTVRNETGIQTPTRRPDMNDGYTTLRLLQEYETTRGLDPTVTYPTYFAGNNLEYYKNNSDPYYHPNVDWWNTLMRDYSLQERVNFDIAGGSDLIKYFVSLGYITQGGIYKDFSKDQGYNGNYFYNRYNFRSNIDIDPTKDLHIRLDLSGRFGVTNEPNDKSWNGGGTTFQYLWNGELSSFGYPVYNENGTLASSSGSGTKPNPVANLMYSGYQRTFDNNFNLVASAKQKLDMITKGLSVSGLVSLASDYNFLTTLTRSSSEILVYFWDAPSNSYKPVTNNLYRMGKLSRGGGFRNSERRLNIQAALNYQRSFGPHNVSAMLMLNQNTNTKNGWDGSSSVISGVPNNFRGFTSRLSYDYRQKYLMDINLGYNGSDRFISSKKYGLFPAVSAGWNISEEKFFKEKVLWADALKIRASYGLVGSDNIGAYKYLYEQVYNSGQTGYNFGETPTAVTGITEGALGNNTVTWEKERKADIGIDAKFFKGKLGVTVDYFDHYRYDILTTRATISEIFGVGLPPVNLGRVSNKGYELEMNYNGAFKAIRYFVRGNVSYAKNKVIYRDEPVQKYSWLALTGKSIGQQFGYKAIGFYKDIEDIYNSPTLTTAVPLKNLFPGAIKLADLNKDGIVDQNDMGAMGANQPTYTAGLSLGISWKGIDVSTLFQGAFDYVINMSRGSIAYARPERVSVPYNLGRWTPGATDVVYPSLAGGTTNGQTSTYWYRSGDYIRWKNFEVGYAIPASRLKRFGLRDARVYANGYNMGLAYTALPVFIDPESAVSASAGEYPQQKVFNLGIQVGL